MNKISLVRSLFALAAGALLLSGCGGGGGDGGGTGGTGGFIRPTTPLGSSAQYEGLCSLEDQKKFVRAYLDEVYLWYDEIVDVDPAKYSSIPDYFNALLVRTPDANGVAKDRFSAVLPKATAQNMIQKSYLPVARSGAQDLVSASFVPVTTVVTTAGGRRAGYILFNDHAIGAQDELITAFRQLKDAGVPDLVLDLRNNSGGYLYVALTAASMVAGPSSQGKVFEKLTYNNKRDAESARSTLTFSSTLQYAETQYPVGTALPQLNLPRVFVLTSGATCSASESIINSLRGIDVQVIRIGTTTCGKPYGFREKDNCGYAYFPIEFKGVNAKGFGDYTTGFQPMCQITDNGSVPGSDSDPLLAGAKYYLDNNACPTGSATGVQSAATPLLDAAQPSRPSWAGRLFAAPER